MKPERGHGAAGRDYTAAHAVHYEGKDLEKAFSLYRDIIASYPTSPEAGYCESQIHNIVKAVVPKQLLLDTEEGLVAAHFAHAGREAPAGTPDEPAVVGRSS